MKFFSLSLEKIAQTQRDNGECQTLQNNFFDPPHYVTDFQWGIRLQGNGGGMRPKDILRAKLLEKVRKFSPFCPIVFLLLTDL